MEPTTPPAYFQNNDIHGLFLRLLDRLDQLPRDQRTNALTRSVSAKNFPVLFRPAAPDDDMVLWLRLYADESKQQDPLSPGHQTYARSVIGEVL